MQALASVSISMWLMLAWRPFLSSVMLVPLVLLDETLGGREGGTCRRGSDKRISLAWRADIIWNLSEVALSCPSPLGERGRGLGKGNTRRTCTPWNPHHQFSTPLPKGRGEQDNDAPQRFQISLAENPR